MNTYLTTKDEKTCYGCLSCVYSCPSGAITIEDRFDKFSYPELDSTKCINCDLCKKVCPYETDVSSDIMHTFGVKNKDEDARKNSTSGGAFTAISDALLEQGYVVYGAGFDDDFRVVHKRAENAEERNALRGSKYVESRMEDIYPEIRKNLESGQKILFIGTPCQVAGLKSFLRKPQDNLITIDLLCGGVGSPRVFEDYLKLITNGKTPKIFLFRDKESGWGNGYNVRVECDGEINEKYKQSFINLYIRSLAKRNSCSSCKFASTKRPGDISIGDFWGIDYADKSFNDGKGVSLVTLNTEKASELLDNIKNAEILKADYSTAVNSNVVLKNPPQGSYITDMFWKYYKKHSIEKTLEIYGGDSTYSKLRRKPFEYINKYIAKK